MYHEFLDAKRNPELLYQQEFLTYIKTKYKDIPLSVLMVADDPGINLILEKRDEYFPTLPIVFMGVNHIQERLLNAPLLTGAFEKHSSAETIVEAVRQTGSNNVILISDSTSTSQANLLDIEAGLAEQGSKPILTVVKDIVDSDIEKKIRRLS